MRIALLFYEVLSRIPTVKVQFVAREAGPLRTDTGYLTLHADYALAELPHPDVIGLPGGAWGTVKASEDATTLAWVREAHAHSTWTTSVCTGALILGAAGILKGLDATTHWAVRDRLKTYGATYQAQRFVQQGKVITAAGVSAGRAVAGSIQLGLEYAPQPHLNSGSPAKARLQERTLSSAALLADFAKGKLKQ